MSLSRLWKSLPFLGLLMIFSGCGYQFGRGAIDNQYTTICIPYVEGDFEGRMTDALIKAVTERGALRYTNTGSELLLKVSLFASEEATIGFAYAPKKRREKFTHVITSNEARLTLGAHVTVIDRKRGESILGPLDLIKSLDYDYESDLTKSSSNTFSLGQLDMQNAAQEAACSALYILLAEKIADYVHNGW